MMLKILSTSTFDRLSLAFGEFTIETGLDLLRVGIFLKFT